MIERKERHAMSERAMSERVPALEKELSRLRKEHAEAVQALAIANERLREVEAARDTALDRIDWAIDSLHNVIDQRQ